MKLYELTAHLQTMAHSGLSEKEVLIDGKTEIEIKLENDKIDIKGVKVGKTKSNNAD